MKTARRQELRTNDLATQIEEIVLFSRRHGREIAGAIIAAAVILVGGYLYVSGKRAELRKGWAELYDVRSQTGLPVPDQVSYFRKIYDRKLEPMLSAMSLIRIGEICLRESIVPRNAPAQRDDWNRQAEQAFQQVLNEFPDLAMPVGIAKLSLGLIAENRGDLQAARDAFRFILDNERFAALPVRSQAEYRLNHLDEWSAAIEFPPPLPTTAPFSTTQPATGAPSTMPAATQPTP
ncbi:MAG: hypothetical protein L6Q92_10370 [Phycisphaerae bacterium]|nr:hypothetical protein [Phycisphaerae bacterium]